MSESKHTPGPWTIEAVYIGRERVNFGEYRFPHQAAPNCAGHSRQYPREQAEANARLISAAPDLLRALIVALPYIAALSPTQDDPEQSEARAVHKLMTTAIAKAEGRA